jgi:hypothetical protein
VNRPDSFTIPSLLLLFAVLPAAAIYSWFKLRSGMPLAPKLQRYRGMIALQLLVFAMASVSARRNGVQLLAPGKISPWIWLTACLYLAFVAVLTASTWPRLEDERRIKVRALLPENPSEMLYWIPICFLAGVTEEYAYRGVAYTAVMEMTQSASATLLLCVGAFAVAHITYGWRAALQAALLAATFHVLVMLTHTLLLVIALHIAYDLMIGFVVVRLLRAPLTSSPKPASSQ